MAEIDRNKVINDLQDAVNDDWMWQHADYYAKAIENAIELLKEQEEQIKNRDESLEKAREEIKWLRGMLKEQEAREQCLKTKCVICPHCDNCDVDENGQLKEQEAIVRCKDCKNWIPGYITDQDDFIPPKCGKYQQMVGHSNDDFCSLAEKKEGL